MNLLKFVTISLMAMFLDPAHSQSQPDREGQGAVLVSLQEENEIPLRAISEIAIQSGMPIGIAFGADQQALCQKETTFHIENQPVTEAAAQIVKAMGFLVTIKNGVLVLEAPDLTPLQKSILDHRFEEYPQQTASSMAGLGMRLTGAIRMEMGNESTFAASTLHPIDSHPVSLSASSGLSTEDIANQIVNLDKHGLWIFHGAAPKPDATSNEAPSPKDAQVSVFSYADNLAGLRNLTCGP